MRRPRPKARRKNRWVNCRVLLVPGGLGSWTQEQGQPCAEEWGGEGMGHHLTCCISPVSEGPGH